MSADDIINQIDHALQDYSVSQDAMRWSPDAPPADDDPVVVDSYGNTWLRWRIIEIANASLSEEAMATFMNWFMPGVWVLREGDFVPHEFDGNAWQPEVDEGFVATQWPVATMDALELYVVAGMVADVSEQVERFVNGASG